MKNECLDVTKAVLEEEGIVYAVEHGAKHYRVDFEINGRRCRQTVAVTPSDRRAPVQARAQIRRLIRDTREATSKIEGSAAAEPQTHDAPVEFLPAITEAEICGAAMPSCEARDVHRALGVGRDFATWIKDRITTYGFAEGVDFEVFTETGENPQGGRPTKAYVISIDMAKELAMVERTPAGRHVRRYFIACEKALRADAPKSEWLAALQSAQSDAADARAAAELALEAVSAMQAHIEGKPVAPTLDLSQTVTSDDLISMAGISHGQRVRGTSSMVTGRMLRFTAGHGCFKTPSHLNPSMPWRFPREKATEWLFGTSLGSEQIRAQVARQRSKRSQRSAQGHLRLIGPSQPSSGA